MAKDSNRDIDKLIAGDNCMMVIDTPEEKYAVLARYFKHGLEGAQRCVALLEAPCQEGFRDALRDAGVALDDELRNGSILILDNRETFLKGGAFDPDHIIGLIGSMVKSARAEGFSGLCYTGDMSWATEGHENIERLLAYESGYAELFVDKGLTGVCIYQRSSLNRLSLLAVLNYHPLLIQKGSLYQNLFFKGHPHILKRAEEEHELDSFIKGLVDFEELKRHKEATDRRYTSLVSTIPGVVLRLVEDWEVEFVSDYVEELTGYPREAFLKKELKWIDLIVPEDREIFLKECSGLQESECVCSLNYRLKRNDGRVIWVRHSIGSVFKESRFSNTNGVVFDDTARKRAEEELDRLNKELRLLITEVTNIEDRDRKRFSRALQENIGQNLVAAKMGLEGTTETSCGSTECVAAIKQSVKLLDETIKATRYMTVDMYPSLLDDIGLESALEWYSHSVIEPAGLKVSLSIDWSVENFPEEAKRKLFHLIKEALKNTMKYARASRVEVSCRSEGGRLHLHIKDDGVGFDQGSIRPGHGLGLLLMREWALSLGGTLEIHTEPGKGTELRGELPKPE